MQPVVPDVSVRTGPDGAWLVELNPEGLPRVLVNQTYAAKVSRTGLAANEKTFISDCLQNANWLTRSLEQRARTILKVASEIVRQQDAFFSHGVEHLRPLNLQDRRGRDRHARIDGLARDFEQVHVDCPRGLFEFKYFFTASIPAQAAATRTPPKPFVSRSSR